MSHSSTGRTKRNLDLLIAEGRLSRLARLTTGDFQVLHRIFLRGITGEEMHRMVQGALLLEIADVESNLDPDSDDSEDDGASVALDNLTLISTTDVRSVGGSERHKNTTGTVPFPAQTTESVKGKEPLTSLPAIRNPPDQVLSGGAGDDEVFPFPGTQTGTDLRNFIARQPERYTMDTSETLDTGKSGSLRYRVLLGDDIYACFPKPRGAEQIAKIARVHGIQHPMVKGRIYKIPPGGQPIVVTTDVKISRDLWLKYGMHNFREPFQ